MIIPIGHDRSVYRMYWVTIAIIVICTPNNPTGNELDPAAIRRIVEEAPCLVLIDEAYSEFAGTSYVEMVDQYPNVLVFRTMSKFAGLAGIRL